MNTLLSKKYILPSCYLVLSYVSVSAINRYFSISQTTRNGSFLNLIWMAGIFMLLTYAHQTAPRARVLGYLFGALLAISLTIGRIVYLENSLYSFFFLRKV